MRQRFETVRLFQGCPKASAADIVKLLATGQSHPSPSFQYLKYYLAVRQALDVNGWSFDELVTKSINAEPLVKQAAESFGSAEVGELVHP